MESERNWLCTGVVAGLVLAASLSLSGSAQASVGCCRYQLPNDPSRKACVTTDSDTCRHRFQGYFAEDKRCLRHTGRCKACTDTIFGTSFEVFAPIAINISTINLDSAVVHVAFDLDASDVDFVDDIFITGCSDLSPSVTQFEARVEFWCHPDSDLIGFTFDTYSVSLASMNVCGDTTGPTTLRTVSGELAFGTIDTMTGEVWGEFTVQLESDLTNGVPVLLEHQVSGTYDDVTGDLDITFDGSIAQQPGDWGPVVLDQLGIGVAVAEGGASDGFTVALAQAPEFDVVVQFELSEDDQLSLTPNMLTFTPINWMDPQPVSAAALDDGDAEGGPQLVRIGTIAVSEDPSFNLYLRSFNSEITDNECGGGPHNPPDLTRDGTLDAADVAEMLVGFFGPQQ